MSSRIAQVTIDVVNPTAVAEFWCAALGYQARPDEGRSIHLAPVDEAAGPTIWLQPVDEPKQGKLRCHLDLEAPDQTAEVHRLLGLGARRADVGQAGDEGFVVMRDRPGTSSACLFDRVGRPVSCSLSIAGRDAHRRQSGCPQDVTVGATPTQIPGQPADEILVGRRIDGIEHGADTDDLWPGVQNPHWRASASMKAD